MRVVVFGATGVQGSAQVRALTAKGHDPVAVSRAPEAWTIDSKAIATFAADYQDLASLAEAVVGSDAIFLNMPSTSFQAAAPLIAGVEVIARAAAASPSTKMLVFNTSLPVSETTRGFAAQDARFEMRRLIFESGVPAVSIQPVVFLDNLMGWGWPPIATRNTIVYPHKESLDVSWICHDDVAALMIAAMERPHLAGRSFAVGGPETVRLPELARKLGRAWDRPLGYESQSLDDFCKLMLGQFGATSSLEAARLEDELRRIYTWYNSSDEHPFFVDMAPVLKELPVELTPIETWARRQRIPQPA
ncbi:MAG: hypothetical protein JWO25_20 [Alphaproteobacteria bacterium]|nr:hypothetical protein [Alphaproteobacteria bacterium]